MAAPVPTARVTPSGKMLERGFKSLITIGSDPDASFWEIEIKPPGMDGGAAIDITTMWNNLYRTKVPGELIELTDTTGKAGYRPQYLADIVSLINQETTITIVWPDLKGICFFGSLTKFDPDVALKERTLPTAAFTIIATNRDPATGEEQGPVPFDWGIGT